MDVSDELIRNCTRRLMIARMRLLVSNAFYGLLLMHVKMGISEEYDTAWTEDGEKLVFNPNFLMSVSDRELDYAMMHLVLHLALNHTERASGFDKERFDEVADIVVNSNILRNCGNDTGSITLCDHGGVQPHLAPDGSEGWMHSVDELYLLLERKEKEKSDDSSDGDEKDEKNPDSSEGDDDEKQDNKDSENGGSEENSSDIGEDNKPGQGLSGKKGWDEHLGSEASEEDSEKEDEWKGYMMQAAKAVAMQRVLTESPSCGDVPAFAERYLEELKKSQTDWRTILTEFIQEDIVDYSFTPPDRRFGDSDFFLPDFNEKDEKVMKILFMIDTSGSMTDEAVTTAYSEVKGTIDQFGGKLEGWLGFFDATVVPPEPFVDESEFLLIRPKGGGGTSFRPIFQYVAEEMRDDPPVSIIILTDGYAPYPEEREAQGIPVLWLLINEDVTPQWGRVARIKVDNNKVNPALGVQVGGIRRQPDALNSSNIQWE